MNEGVRGAYAVVWLRDCSPESATYTMSPAMSARNLQMRSFDVEPSPLSVSVDEERKYLLIEWPQQLLSK